MATEKIDQLFRRYEKAFADLDIEKIGMMYADSFISAGPKGTIAQSKNDFMNKADQARKFYQSIGQDSARILSKKIYLIGEVYSMVTVHWGVTFKKTGDELIEFDVTYIVQESDTEPKIILFITHQDEEEAMKKLGLEPQMTG
jgi:Domain of unknown function (DUF4440)